MIANFELVQGFPNFPHSESFEKIWFGCFFSGIVGVQSLDFSGYGSSISLKWKLSGSSESCQWFQIGNWKDGKQSFCNVWWTLFTIRNLSSDRHSRESYRFCKRSRVSHFSGKHARPMAAQRTNHWLVISILISILIVISTGISMR